ncbi:MAG TPA: DUF3224 domain-containing protein [Paucimonas sp.]|nr:DUF3224 domain-containing protein [Paucimonas sp.]
MSERISGAFDVKLTPQAADPAGSSVGRMAIEKRFHGDLDGAGKGQMLAFRTPIQGSAGYVAIEQVTGFLKGRKGSFVLQHSGIMERGAPQLAVTVVPDSGTDELAGIAGKMTINIVDGKHFYDFEYSLPAKP